MRFCRTDRPKIFQQGRAGNHPINGSKLTGIDKSEEVHSGNAINLTVC